LFYVKCQQDHEYDVQVAGCVKERFVDGQFFARRTFQYGLFLHPEKIGDRHQRKQDDGFIIEDRHDQGRRDGRDNNKREFGQAVFADIVDDVERRHVTDEIKQRGQPQPHEKSKGGLAAGYVFQPKDHKRKDSR